MAGKWRMRLELFGVVFWTLIFALGHVAGIVDGLRNPNEEWSIGALFNFRGHVLALASAAMLAWGVLACVLLLLRLRMGSVVFHAWNLFWILNLGLLLALDYDEVRQWGLGVVAVLLGIIAVFALASFWASQRQRAS